MGRLEGDILLKKGSVYANGMNYGIFSAIHFVFSCK